MVPPGDGLSQSTAGLDVFAPARLPLHFYRNAVSVEAQRNDSPVTIMADARIPLPQGTLDLLILRTLALGPEHGWAISERVQQISREVLQIPQGSLYPALHRLERRGWIRSRWGVTEANRRAKYYELTPRGRHRLEAGESTWRRMAAAVLQILEAT